MRRFLPLLVAVCLAASITTASAWVFLHRSGAGGGAPIFGFILVGGDSTSCILYGGDSSTCIGSGINSPSVPAQVQSARAANAGSGTSRAVTLASAGAGNLIVLGTLWCNDSSCATSGGTVSSVTDTSGDSCVQAPGAASTATGTSVLLQDVWYCTNTGAASETVTVNYSGTVWYATVNANAFSGVATSTPLDSVTFTNGPPANQAFIYVPTNGNTAQANDLIYSVATTNSGVNQTPNNTALNGSGTNFSDEYQISGAAGPYLNSWTLSGTPAEATSSMVAFKAATSGPGFPTNTAKIGAYVDFDGSGYETTMGTMETWLSAGSHSLYNLNFPPDNFLCVAAATNCINNPTGSGGWLTTSVLGSPVLSSSRNEVWSVGLTGCADTSCGSTVPLAGSNSIASGFEDSVFNTAFAAIASAYPKSIIRLGWEMNSASFLWSVGQAGGSTTSNNNYVLAFQHVAALAHNNGLTVQWCPDIGYISNALTDYFYPGDAYVDYIGTDFYDITNSGTPALSWTHYLQEQYGLLWAVAFANQHGKPFSFGEWGIGAEGDTQGAYIISHLASFMQNNNVKWFDYWNSNSGYAGLISGTAAGTNGPPYQYTTSAAAFLAAF